MAQSGNGPNLNPILALLFIVLIVGVIIMVQVTPFSDQSAWSGWAGSLVGSVVGTLAAVMLFLIGMRLQFGTQRAEQQRLELGRQKEETRGYRREVQMRARRLEQTSDRIFELLTFRRLTTLEQAVVSDGYGGQALAALERDLRIALTAYSDALDQLDLLLPPGPNTDLETHAFLGWLQDSTPAMKFWVISTEMAINQAIIKLIEAYQIGSTYSYGTAMWNTARSEAIAAARNGRKVLEDHRLTITQKEIQTKLGEFFPDLALPGAPPRPTT